MTSLTTRVLTRVALYARVSTEEQSTEEHHSLEAQFNEMHEYADH